MVGVKDSDGVGEVVGGSKRRALASKTLMLIFDAQLCLQCLTEIDGGWTQWSKYSQCSVTCDHGVIKRDRKCKAPAPAGGGRPCLGHGSDQKPCVMEDCRKHFLLVTC